MRTLHLHFRVMAMNESIGVLFFSFLRAAAFAEHIQPLYYCLSFHFED